jgi:hypothetical protein
MEKLSLQLVISLNRTFNSDRVSGKYALSALSRSWI